MRRLIDRALTRILIGGYSVIGIANAEGLPEKPTQPIDAEWVARLPYPGTVSPTSVEFAPGGDAITYLLPEDRTSLGRVLWRTERPGGSPRVVARPPGEGTTEENVSREEELRRERQRLRATGISQVVRAGKADAVLLPLGGDIYLQRGAGPLERLTESPAPEIDPKPNADATKVAFVRGGELYVIDVASRDEVRLTTGAEDGLTHGLAEFIAQEELDRSTGYWWSSDGSRIAYQETDERHIPPYTIAHQEADTFSTETHRYPFAGAENAKVRLGVVPVVGGETRWLDFADPGDDAYLARVEWDGPKQLLIQVLDRDQRRLQLIRLDVETGRRQVLVEETSDTWINLHNDLRVVEETGEFVWSSERLGFRQLELRDRDGQLVRALTSGDHPVDEVRRSIKPVARSGTLRRVAVPWKRTSGASGSTAREGIA